MLISFRYVLYTAITHKTRPLPVVIGTAVRPRCFKNLKTNNLPMIWRNNKKAWMTAATM
jgi:hypothetical protein